MQFRKSPIAVAAFALFGALPLAAQAQSTPAPSSGSLDVWFKAPKAGSTVSGVLNGGTSCYVKASGSVARVEFSVDGNGLNTDSRPSDGMQCALDTTRLSNGVHELRADAYDSSGNQRSDVISINVSNTTSTGGGSTGGDTGSTGGGSTPPAGYAGTPYTGSAVSLPASVVAVNFDKGGEGVAYHDLSSTNLGGLYRASEAVDIYASTDTGSGPYQIANFQNGEWMTYTVNVPANGNYDLGIRAANNAGTGAFHIEVDGVNVTGTVQVANTGKWTNYQWFGKQGVALTAGTHVVRLVADQQWFNVSALSMLASGTTGSGSTGSGSTGTGDTGGGSTGGGSTPPAGYAGTPYTGSAVSLPANVVAVNFDKGGEGVAYHDLSSGNLGGLYRASEAIDIYASTDTASGPYQIANFQTGEWMKYPVKVAANGNYDLGIRASNNAAIGAFHIEVDGANVTGTVQVPSTGSWNTYQWFGKKGVPLTAGTHVVRLVADQQWFNVSALSMPASGTTGSGSTGGDTGSTGGSGGTKPSNLLFWSGFEGALSLTTPNNCYANGCFQQLTGTDSSTGDSWPFSLKGGTTQFQLLANSTTYPTSSTIGSWMYNELRNVVGHKGNQTKALYQEVRQSGCCGTDSQGGGSTQDPMLVQPGSEPGDIYMSKWIMLQPDLLDKLRAGDAWRTIFEWKEGKTGDDGAFRVTLSAVAYNGTPLTWDVRWDNLAGPVSTREEYWRKFNSSVPVPVGEWFKLEVFWHRSTGSDGRVWFAVNGQVIDDHYGRTIGDTNAPINRIFASQLYSGSVYPIYQWMDDVQVWQGWPTAKQGDAWYDPPYAPH